MKLTDWTRKRRLRRRLSEDNAILRVVRNNAADPIKDRTGTSSVGLASELILRAKMECCANANFDVFRTLCREAAILRLGLFRRFRTGEPIDRSYLSMVASFELFVALATGDQQLSVDFAKEVGGRPEIEVRNDIPFVQSLGYTLKHAVLDEQNPWATWGTRFMEICQSGSEFVNFVGHAQVLNAIRTRDVAAADSGFRRLLNGHIAECRRQTFFGELDRQLCVWGVGMANLCRWRGLRFPIRSAIVPDELLVT